MQKSKPKEHVDREKFTCPFILQGGTERAGAEQKEQGRNRKNRFIITNKLLFYSPHQVKKGRNSETARAV